MSENTVPGPDVDLDALYGHPPGYLNAIQWLFLGDASPQELLEAAAAIERELEAKPSALAHPVVGVDVLEAGVAPPREKRPPGRRHGRGHVQGAWPLRRQS